MAHPPRTCPQCGAAFVPLRSTKRACSQRCQRLLWHHEHREQSIATTKAWQSANAERHVAQKRAWGLANRERKRIALRRFYRAHPRYGALASSRRRAAILANSRTSGPSERDLARLIDRFGGRCAYCGVLPNTLHIDHVVPLVRGGSNDLGNLLPACRDCNLEKGRRLLVEWRRITTRLPRQKGTSWPILSTSTPSQTPDQGAAAT